MPTTSTVRQRVALPDFTRAARLGSFLSAFGWLVVVVGVVVGLFVAAADGGFSVALFLLAVFGSLCVGLVVIGVSRLLEIAAYVGEHTAREMPPSDVGPRSITLPASRRAATGG